MREVHPRLPGRGRRRGRALRGARRQVHGRRRARLLRLAPGARGRRRAGGPGRPRHRRGGGRAAPCRPASRSPRGSASRPGWSWSATWSGEGAAREQAVVGETPNLAARLQELAEPGSGRDRRADTRGCSASLFELARPRRRRALKGFAEPVRAWPRARRASGRGPLRGPARAPASRRWSAASRSSRCCSSAGSAPRTGEGQVVLLSRRAGHRQVAARAARLRERLAERAAHAACSYSVLALPHGQRALPGHRAARAGGGLRARTTRRRSSSTSSRRCSARHVPTSPRRVPLLAALLAIPAARALPAARPHARSSRRSRRFQALLAQLEGLAARGPVLMRPRGRALGRPDHARAARPRGRARASTCRCCWSSPSARSSRRPGPATRTSTLLTLSRLSRRQAAAMVGAGHGRQGAAAEVCEQIVAQDRRRAAVRRGADQDGAGVRAAARTPASRYALTGPAAAARDPGDAAGLADGPARPAGAGQGGGADRRRDRPGVLLRAAGGGRRAAARTSCGTRWPSWSPPGWSSAAGSRPRRVYTLQARAGAGRRLRNAAARPPCPASTGK